MAAFGAPIFVHWSVVVAIGLIALVAFSGPIYAVLFVGSYLAVLLMHELGHAFVARRLGYRVDAIGLSLLHGWCRCEAPDNEWDAVLVAWGGVAAQVAIALPVLLIALALGDRDWTYFTPIVVLLGYLNLVIAIINLVPDDYSDGRLAWRIIPLLLQERRAKRAVVPSAREYLRHWMRWQIGRQNTGYDKFLLLANPFLIPFDLYLLRLPDGSEVPPHRDRVTGRRHFRLNIVLRRSRSGGEFICTDPIFATKRIKLFRSDVSVHAVTKVQGGTRYVLSFGWVLKGKAGV